MLIPTRHPREKTYYVEFAKWSGFTNATDPEEAATLLFEEVLEKYRDHTEVSPVFTVVNLSKAMKCMDLADNTHFVYSPHVLANAGMHKTSKELQNIIENLKTDGEE
jgi:hypothetical protein|tara:strand:+ start:75 stop:395 length:321 start_codon:yes stop_codon:yes gene_type:complete